MLDETFSLTTGEDEGRKHFEELAVDTYEFCTSQNVGILWPFAPSSENVFYQFERDKVPPSLSLRWERWKNEYSEIRARNPRLELFHRLKEIGETHDCSSWPYGKERDIQGWIDAGDATAAPPFDDRQQIVTPEFFQKLTRLRQRCDGWFYWNHNAGHVVFATEAEWQAVCTELDAQERERRHKIEQFARSRKIFGETSNLVDAARQDQAFWERLKEWELAQEANHLAETTVQHKTDGTVSGPVRMEIPKDLSGRVMYLSREDAIFEEFVARIKVPEVSPTPLELFGVVMVLRSAVRKELGLDENHIPLARRAGRGPAST